MIKLIIDTFFIHMKYNGSFSMLTYTLVSSVKVSLNGCSFTDVYMKLRNVYMPNSRTPGISVAHLLKEGVYLSAVFQNVFCLLIDGNCAAVVMQGGCCTSQCSGGGCMQAFLRCVGYID